MEGDSTGPSNKVKTAIYVLISLALLVFYCIQVKGFTVQAGVWIAVILIGGGMLWYGMAQGPMETALLVLIGLSAGMVISNANIKLA